MAEPGQILKSDVRSLKGQARIADDASEWVGDWLQELEDRLSGLEDTADSPGSGDSPGNGEDTSARRGTSALSGRLSFQTDSQKIILIAMTITVLVALIENAHKGPKDKGAVPQSTIIIGGFVSGGLLLAMSYFIPEFASGLAIIAMTATVLERGKPFWDIVTTLTGKTVPSVGKGGPVGITSGDASISEVPASSIPGGPGHPQVYVGPDRGINVHI